MANGKVPMRSDVADERKSYFEELYAKHNDPWCYDTCDYEIDKRADTLTFLGDSYRRACEVGCSNGVLTKQLAPLCHELIGIDVAEAATVQARERLAGWSNVEIKLMHLPHQDLDGAFDLLVLSEVLYFLSATELAAMAGLAARRMVPGGDVIVVSYDGETQTGLTGRQATDLFLAGCVADFETLRSEQRQGYHVRLLRRRHVGD